MKRLLLVVLAACVAAAGAYGADPLLPVERLTPADMAKARAATLRARDLGPGWKGERLNEPEEPLRCKGFQIDEHDLVETGEAESLVFTKGDRLVYSSTSVYRTTTMAVTSWRRAIRPGLAACLAEDGERELSEPGFAVRRRSAARVPFPTLASGTAAYHLVFTFPDGTGQRHQFYADFVFLRHGRILAGVFLISFDGPNAVAEIRRLAGVLAQRMR